MVCSKHFSLSPNTHFPASLWAWCGPQSSSNHWEGSMDVCIGGCSLQGVGSTVPFPSPILLGWSPNSGRRAREHLQPQRQGGRPHVREGRASRWKEPGSLMPGASLDSRRFRLQLESEREILSCFMSLEILTLSSGNISQAHRSVTELEHQS